MLFLAMSVNTPLRKGNQNCLQLKLVFKTFYRILNSCLVIFFKIQLQAFAKFF